MQKWMKTEGKGVDEVARLCKSERMQVAGMQTSNTVLSCSSTPAKGLAASCLLLFWFGVSCSFDNYQRRDMRVSLQKVCSLDMNRPGKEGSGKDGGDRSEHSRQN